MLFNRHSDLIGQHAFLSASKYHWINYDEDKLERVFATAQAAKRGSDLHDLAFQLIRLGVKLPRAPKTLNMYVNDALGYRMIPEQVLYYSPNAFGTADAIVFRQNMLRIHDLKTGQTPSSVHQLEVYAAFFCLEYHMSPFEIGMEFRIYQSDEVQVYEGDPDVIVHIMDRVVTFDKQIELLRMEEP